MVVGEFLSDPSGFFEFLDSSDDGRSGKSGIVGEGLDGWVCGSGGSPPGVQVSDDGACGLGESGVTEGSVRDGGEEVGEGLVLFVVFGGHVGLVSSSCFVVHAIMIRGL